MKHIPYHWCLQFSHLSNVPNHSINMDVEGNFRGFPGCKYNHESTTASVFSTLSSIVLIAHLIVMISNSTNNNNNNNNNNDNNNNNNVNQFTNTIISETETTNTMTGGNARSGDDFTTTFTTTRSLLRVLDPIIGRFSIIGVHYARALLQYLIFIFKKNSMKHG